TRNTGRWAGCLKRRFGPPPVRRRGYLSGPASSVRVTYHICSLEPQCRIRSEFENRERVGHVSRVTNRALRARVHPAFAGSGGARQPKNFIGGLSRAARAGLLALRCHFFRNLRPIEAGSYKRVSLAGLSVAVCVFAQGLAKTPSSAIEQIAAKPIAHELHRILEMWRTNPRYCSSPTRRSTSFRCRDEARHYTKRDRFTSGLRLGGAACGDPLGG